MNSSSIRGLGTTGFVFWLVIAALCLYSIFPLRKAVRFGIDLVGGTYITLEVQTEKALDADLLARMQTIPSMLENARKEKPVSHKVENGKLTLTFSSPAAAQDAMNVLKMDGDLKYSVEGSVLSARLTERKEKFISEDAVKRNIEVLRSRLDKMSVAEITIVPQGERNIVVELPDVSDPQQAKAMIGRAAILEFKLVDKTGKTREDILYEYDGDMPDGFEIVPGRRVTDGFYLVPQYAQLTGAMLRDARPNHDERSGGMAVAFTLTEEGGRIFEDISSKNYGKQLAVILDGVVITAPVIQTTIKTDGQITGNFSVEEAKELSLLLKSGAFVAPVTFEEERQIGPSLGEESIQQGLLSCVVGLVLLFIFSIYYYKMCGLFAFVALLFNLVLTLVGLSWLQATLTLPGIAGMVLTIGMAIDASVLIYEHIKEELAAGKTLRESVDTGFGGAMRVILDGNITTFIVGVVLYRFGTGPIQGFAVTMMLGIIATLITGLFFLKSIFNLLLDNFRVQKLKI